MPPLMHGVLHREVEFGVERFLAHFSPPDLLASDRYADKRVGGGLGEHATVFSKQVLDVVAYTERVVMQGERRRG